jgi:hypothetical protein
MVYYWKYLSANRVSRISKFASVLRTVMFNHWSDVLIHHRSKRHVARYVKAVVVWSYVFILLFCACIVCCVHIFLFFVSRTMYVSYARSDSQQQLFARFKTCINAYKTETLHQREVLRKLYQQVVDKLDVAEHVQKDLSLEYLSILKRIIDMYTSALKTTLVQYKNAKIAYISTNKQIFQHRQAQIDTVHEKCRTMLREAASDLHGSFIENCVKPQILRVSESVGLGEAKYNKVKSLVLAVEGVFLSSASEAFVSVAVEVRKSLNEFEYTVKNMIYEWNDMEERINRVVRKDRAAILYDIKACLHDLNGVHNLGLKPFFVRYREIEEIVVSYMMERYYSFQKLANNEEDSVISSKAAESIRTLTSEEERAAVAKKKRKRKEKKRKKRELEKEEKGRIAEEASISSSKRSRNIEDGNSVISARDDGMSHHSASVVAAGDVNVDADADADADNDGDADDDGDDDGIEESKEDHCDADSGGDDDEEVAEQDLSDKECDEECDSDSDSDGDDESDGDNDSESNTDSEEEDVRDEDGFLVLPPNKCGLDFLLRLNTAIEGYTEQTKAHIMGEVRDRFMAEILAKEEERKSERYEIAQTLVDTVANQWIELNTDLQMLVSSHIVSARNLRSEMALKLWQLASDFRTWEFNRLQLLNEASIWGFKKLRRPEMSRSDNKDLKLFEKFARASQNVIISAEVDLAPGHAEVMPVELSSFLTQINTNPAKMMTEFSGVIKEFFTKSHSDVMHYNFLTTMEYLSNSLQDVRAQVNSIVEDYEQDKMDTINLLKYNSNVKRHVKPNIQVGSVLDTMVETVVARNAMSKNLADQMRATDNRSKIVEKEVNVFLNNNSFSDNFLADGTMDPQFIEDTALGHNDVEECKLKHTSANKHGICLKCTAELFYTVKRNDTIYTSKINAVSEKLKGLISQEAIDGRIIRKQLHTLLRRECLEMDKLEFGIRNEIIGCLEVAFKKRVEFGETNSRVNEPAESVNEERLAGPFVRDTDAILQELVASVKKPPRKEGMVIDYPEFSDISDDDDEDDEDEEEDEGEGEGGRGGDVDCHATGSLHSGDLALQQEEKQQQQEEEQQQQQEQEQEQELNTGAGSQATPEDGLGDRQHFSVEDVYFNGIFQRTNEHRDGNPVLHGDKTLQLPTNPMEFSTSETLKVEEKEIEVFLRKHEEYNIMEQDLEDVALEEEKEAIEEAELVATYNETQEQLEKERLAEEERLRGEELRKEAEREAIRLEAYEQAEMEFFQKYPDKDPNIYSYSNKFDISSLSYKETKTMVNPKTYEEASDEYKDLALEKLLNIGGNPNKKDPFDTFVPPPEVPGLPLASVLARYQDMVR